MRMCARQQQRQTGSHFLLLQAWHDTLAVTAVITVCQLWHHLLNAPWKKKKKDIGRKTSDTEPKPKKKYPGQLFLFSNKKKKAPAKPEDHKRLAAIAIMSVFYTAIARQVIFLSKVSLSLSIYLSVSLFLTRSIPIWLVVICTNKNHCNCAIL